MGIVWGGVQISHGGRPVLWEDVEIAIDSAYEDNYESGDAYVEDVTAPRAHVDARVPDTGKYLTCMLGM